jgi:hypothetical protein
VAECDNIVSWFDATKEKRNADLIRKKNERAEVSIAAMNLIQNEKCMIPKW